jgi:hypothetical protein
MRLLATILFLTTTLLLAQDAAPKKGGGGPPKNLKILKAEEVRPMMGMFRTSLGVNCQFCHVQGDNASDENPKKNVARTMIKIMNDANASLGPDAKVKVTCYTCHRGKNVPESAPPAQ